MNNAIIDWFHPWPVEALQSVSERFLGEEMIRAMLEAGGEEQLQVPDTHGQLPIHLAAQKSSSSNLIRVCLELSQFSTLTQIRIS